MAEIRAKIGKKGDANKADNSKIAKGKKPSAGDVEGQWQYVDVVSCPYCYSLNEVTVDTNVYLGYWCWNCGGYFTI
jgi:hypothetical protein